MVEKHYVGKGWASKYGIRIAVNMDELAKCPRNQYGDVKLEVVQRREPDAKSKATHYVIEDTYVPKQQEQPAPKQETKDQPF